MSQLPRDPRRNIPVQTFQRRTYPHARRRSRRQRRTRRRFRGVWLLVLLLIFLMWLFNSASASYTFNDLCRALNVHDKAAYARLGVLCLAVTLVALLVRIWRRPPPE